MSEALRPTTADLVDVLWGNVENLRSGDRSPAVANAVSTSVGTILRVAKLQMEHDKMTGRTPAIPMFLSAGPKSD